jgi:hypothetical protein
VIAPKSIPVALSAVVVCVFATSSSVEAKKKQSDDAGKQEDTIPAAVVTGLAGEQYIFYGLGGIVVEQNPKPGIWHSNMRSYKISIDGSKIGATTASGAPGSATVAADFAASDVDKDFNAVAGIAYFVSGTVSCTLPTAAGSAGREVLVCNNSKDGAVKYCTAAGESISGQASGTVTNSKAFKVDRLISDGKNWFLE